MDLYLKMDKCVWSSWTQDAFLDQLSNWDHTPAVHHQYSASDHGGGDEWEDSKGGSASKNHSEAEKRRRDRINAHLATLRKLVSISEKVIRHRFFGINAKISVEMCFK